MKFRKVLCGVTAAALMLGTMTAAASAEEVKYAVSEETYAAAGDEINKDYIVYIENPDGTLRLSRRTGRGFYDFIIPATLEGKNVTSIDSRVFQDELLTFISIPDTVTSIGEAAFFSCGDLSSIKLSSSITAISDYMLSDTALTDITIPDAVTTIGDGAFKDCKKLTAVSIPNNVTTIGQFAFDSCTGLTSVTLPNSLTSIGNNEFSNCENLTSVTIPNSITSLGAFVFQNSGIKDIYFTGTKAQWEQILNNGRWDGKIGTSYPAVHCSDGDITHDNAPGNTSDNTSGGTSTNKFDLNGDGVVNIADVILLLQTLVNG